TSDEPPLVRLKAALLVTAVAEYFRDQGRDVVLMMDSVPRVAMAQREIGLAAGEPPTTRRNPPSVFSVLSRLLERSGPGPRGTITGLYTVLVEGDDLSEPISDTVRSILDGHIVLSRKLAERNHYPAVDVLASVSRLMSEVTDERHRAAAAHVREILATYADAEDLANIGAYSPGSNPRIDHALARIEDVCAVLRQVLNETAPMQEKVQRMVEQFGLRSSAFRCSVCWTSRCCWKSSSRWRWPRRGRRPSRRPRRWRGRARSGRPPWPRTEPSSTRRRGCGTWPGGGASGCWPGSGAWRLNWPRRGNEKRRSASGCWPATKSGWCWRSWRTSGGRSIWCSWPAGSRPCWTRRPSRGDSG